ncbi:MAG: hypothetical protein Q8L14_08590, partial [Myxococcales bacterium]|nr:hypothetical protein [Myxococcales bacterium]
VCCGSVCHGTCSACNLAGSVGTCRDYSAGQDPENACGLFGCNGAGVCNTSCSGACASTQCDPGAYCAGSTCTGKKSNGASCTSTCECSSGQCVDGVCCNTACAGACSACNFAGFIGTCRAQPAGTDPENNCGLFTCNGSGSCNTTCTGGCASNQCDLTSSCSGTSCAPKRVFGTTCAGNCDCLSGFCVDGVCCNTACNGACQRCSLLPGQIAGICTNVPAYLDPDNDCGRYTCTGSGSCYSGCSGVCGNACDLSNSWCSVGTCEAKRTTGQPCIGGCQCASGTCLGFCT